MNKFKTRWEIQKNWQLVFPLMGLVLLGYSAFRFASLVTGNFPAGVTILASIGIAFLLLKGCLFLFQKLEKKWVVQYKWEMIRIFIVFTLTGSSSVFIGRPIIKLLGVTPDNLSTGLYWFLYIFIAMIFYQILLVLFGWLLGQFQFFWEFEKKMLRRFGL